MENKKIKASMIKTLKEVNSNKILNNAFKEQLNNFVGSNGSYRRKSRKGLCFVRYCKEKKYHKNNFAFERFNLTCEEHAEDILEWEQKVIKDFNKAFKC